MKSDDFADVLNHISGGKWRALAYSGSACGITNMHTYTTKDAAHAIMGEMGPVHWETPHAGKAACPCYDNEYCEGIFQLTGRLTVRCVNPYCRNRTRGYSIPEGSLQQICEKWNTDEAHREGFNRAMEMEVAR